MAERDDLFWQEDSKPPARSLYRPRDRRLLGGVCAGIARYYGWSPNRVRVVYLIGSVLSAAFPGTLVYLALWLIMPDDPRGPASGRR